MMKNSVKQVLKPNVDKTKIMKINCASSKPIKINDRNLEEVSSFVYLGSTVSVNEEIKVKLMRTKTLKSELTKHE